jgi:hypothetical protein
LIVEEFKLLGRAMLDPAQNHVLVCGKSPCAPYSPSRRCCDGTLDGKINSNAAEGNRREGAHRCGDRIRTCGNGLDKAARAIGVAKLTLASAIRIAPVRFRNSLPFRLGSLCSYCFTKLSRTTLP